MSAERQDDGFLYVSRADRDHPVVGFGQQMLPADRKKPCHTKGEAWMDIVNFLDVPIAQMSPESLGDRWNWRLDDVRNFLGELREAGMIKDGAR